MLETLWERQIIKINRESKAKTMDLYNLAQFGVAIFSVGALVYVITFVVKRFLDFLKQQEDNFNLIIKNHLHSDTEAKNELKNSNFALTKAVEHLIRYFEKRQ